MATSPPPAVFAGHTPPAPPAVPTHAGPRLLPDVVVAVVAFVFLGLPTLLFAARGQDASTTILGITGSPTSVIANLLGPFSSLTILVAAIGMPLAVAWRAARSVASAVAVYAMALVHFVTGAALLPVDLLIFLSLYSITIYGPRPAQRAGLAGGMIGAALMTLNLVPVGSGTSGLFGAATLFTIAGSFVLLAWGAGLLRRSRMDQRETVRERTFRLERERDQQSQIATVNERNRIAREMHDIVAHSLSVIIAQADGGRYAAAADPGAATKALTTVSETGRAALADMRRILGVLRDENGTTVDLIPQPADADVDLLIQQVRAAGLPVSHVEVGTARALPPGTGVAVYRIMQESLTNILKHAGPGASAIVTTQWSSATLTVTVADDGRGAAALPDGDGHGLVGMRERAVMLGGTLVASPRPGGGFRVQAAIPVPAARPPAPTTIVGP